jgi:alkylation response protein AidB-like acyl-CoA dehydrogenase
MAGAQFSWAAGADVFSGLTSAYSSWASADANSIVSKANADAQNTIRKAQNEERASGLSLAATMRGIVDSRILNAAGDASNSANELIVRTQQSWVRGNIEQGLRDMETLGSVTAKAAAAGVGGSSVAAVESSLRLAQERRAEQAQRGQDQTTYELLKQRSGIMPAAVSRMDLTPLSANLDYSRNYAASNSEPNLMAALTEGLLRKAPSLQVALDSLTQAKTTDASLYPTTGDFTRMDRGTGYDPLTIN